MATLGELTAKVFRDLADESKTVFSTAQVEDFVRGGIAELNRIAPYDTYGDIDLQTGITAYYTGISHPYRVEVRSSKTGDIIQVPFESEDMGSLTGWSFKQRPDISGGTIEFPRELIRGLDASVWYARVHGYVERPNPTAATSSVMLTFEDEYVVREYAKAEGFTLLTHDRAMFAQWQGQTNNTDVSPTQMMNMAADAKREWNRRRGLARVVRRY
jgi:hypothetical protein